MKRCASCETTRWMEFECIACCVRWLSKMRSKEEIQINAPVIEKVMGADYMEQVRQAYKARKR